MPVAYIAGPITGRENFAKPFNDAASKLRQSGWQVLNPAELPPGMTEPAYMDICLAMVRHCDAILMLPGWEDSDGATCERALAIKCGKPRFYHLGEVPVVADL
jgi:nucleoside 2-deoxyribosyltransferase